MNTTSVILEFLISGLQFTLSLVLVVFCFVSVDSVPFEQLKGADLALAALLLPIAYPLGVFVDNLADALFAGRERKLRGAQVPDNKKSVMALLVVTRDPFLTQHFEYGRVRIRISRSSALNFSLLTIASVVFTIANFHSRGGILITIIVIESVLGIALTSLALYSWQHVTKSQSLRLKHAWYIHARLKEEGIV